METAAVINFMHKQWNVDLLYIWKQLLRCDDS